MKAMNKILFALLLLPGLTSAQQAYRLKGTVQNWKGQDTVIMLRFEKDKQIQDTTIAVNGRFEFKGQLAEPRQVFIYRLDNLHRDRVRDGNSCYIEPGIVTIQAKDSLRKSTITSRYVNNDHREITALVQPFMDKIVVLRNKAMALAEEQRKGAEGQALDKEYRIWIDSITAVRSRFVRSHPASFISLETLNSMAGTSMQYHITAPLFQLLTKEIKQTPLGKDFSARLETAARIVPGAVMPSFAALDTTRREVKLIDVLKNAKVVLVDFWASWCKPCRAENPNVVKTFNAFHQKGFDIISVSLDDNADRWKNAIIKDGMPWHHVSGLKKWDEPVAKQLGISAVPDNFLLDAQGKVIARGLRGEDLYNKIKEILQ